MRNLNAFLNPIKTENKEVIISDRFQEEGKVIPFIIRPISQTENEALIRKHTKKEKKSGNEVLDRVSYNQDMTAKAVVFPDLENAELQKAYGVLGASKLLASMLYVGEFALLMQEVQELSGLDKDINEEIDEVKNE